jgi:putative DNA methylase
MVYNHAEVNPFEKTSGSFEGLLNSIVTAIRFASLANNPCDVALNSVLHLKEEFRSYFDIIVTDPPYLNDVQYGELSELFYVWLYRALKDFYPELPPLAPTEEDISVSSGRFGSNSIAEDFYEKALKEAFKNIYKVLKDDGLLVLFFAHSSTKAWNILLEVIREAKFKVISSYAIHTEKANSITAMGKTSFMSSIIVSCRKIHKDHIAYFEDVLPKIEDKVKNMLTNLTLEDLLGLPMTDLLIMTYGKVLEETTQHTILKSYRANFKPEYENLIKDAREFILKEIVTKLTGRSPNMLGSNMSFYILTKVFYGGSLDSDEALKVAWSNQLTLEELVSRQVVKNELGITKLMFFDEISFEEKPEDIDKNNLHQQLLYLEYIMDKEGVSGVKRIISNSHNFKIQDLKQIINLLIKSYRIRFNKKESLNWKEQKELEILESMADIFNSSIPSNRNTLDNFL